MPRKPKSVSSKPAPVVESVLEVPAGSACDESERHPEHAGIIHAREAYEAWQLARQFFELKGSCGLTLAIFAYLVGTLVVVGLRPDEATQKAAQASVNQLFDELGMKQGPAADTTLSPSLEGYAKS